MKKYLPLAFLSILFVLLLLFLNTRSSLNFVEEQKQITPTIIPTPTEIQQQTYRNAKLNFEINYPENWVINDSDPANIRLCSQLNQNECFNIVKQTLPFDKFIVSFNKAHNSTVVATDVNVSANLKAKSIFVEDQLSQQNYGIYYISQDKTYLTIEYSSSNFIDTEGYKIFSTFKFLPDTSTWKTYTNSDFKVSFSYPSKFNPPTILHSQPTDSNKFTLIQFQTECTNISIGQINTDKTPENYLTSEYYPDVSVDYIAKRIKENNIKQINIGEKETVNIGPDGMEEIDNYFVKNSQSTLIRITTSNICMRGYSGPYIATPKEIAEVKLINDIIASFKFTN